MRFYIIALLCLCSLAQALPVGPPGPCGPLLAKKIFQEKLMVEKLWSDLFVEIISPPHETADGTLRVISGVLLASREDGFALHEDVAKLSGYSPNTVRRYMVSMVTKGMVQTIRLREKSGDEVVQKVYYRLTPKALDLFSQFEMSYLKNQGQLRADADSR